MAFVYGRKRSPFWHYRIKDPTTQEWVTTKTRFRVDDPHGRRNAKRLADADQRKTDELHRGLRPALPADLLVRAYALDTWIKEREAADLDWKTDLGRLNNHILPAIGHLPIVSVGTPRIVALVRALRFPTDPAKKRAQRTVYNIYSVLSALFRDAKLAGLIDQSPCVLTERQLGPVIDKDPLWRGQAVFTREEAEQLISDERIPLDRRVYYALMICAGLRPGEIAALRMQNYDAALQPLGQLVVAQALNTRKNRVKGTKTNVVRYVPVHPTLAEMLGEWLLSGYEAMVGRKPEPGDLLLPLPPSAASRRRSREGEPIRSGDYAGKRWREEDMVTLQADGWRYREMYDGKSTFITLILDDGADEHVIKTRVTHAKPQEDAFSGYNRGLQWNRTCAEVLKLKMTRRSARATSTPASERGSDEEVSEGDPDRVSLDVSLDEPSSEKEVEAAGVERSRASGKIGQERHVSTRVVVSTSVLPGHRRHAVTQGRVSQTASVRISDEDPLGTLVGAVLAGEYERAVEIARYLLDRGVLNGAK